jgi:hypothetical protein
LRGGLIAGIGGGFGGPENSVLIFSPAAARAETIGCKCFPLRGYD